VSDSDRLLEFIAAAKARGVGDDFIVTLLRQNGWSERRIYAAFSSHYENLLGAPIPSRGERTEYAGDAFLYLLLFISLSFWTVALGQLFYALIDRAFPDPLLGPYVAGSFRETVTYQLATIIVAFPIFIWLSRMTLNALRVRPESAESGVRRWLTYIALVLATICMLGDAIWFLQGFLRGDLTVPFVLKALVLLALAGGIFVYYLNSLRAAAVNPLRDRSFAAAATLAVAAGLAFGFLGVGSPDTGRQIELDQRRISQLQEITGLVRDWYTSHHALPPNVASLPNGDSFKDPERADPYPYTTGAGSAYTVCATFALPDSSVRSGDFKHAAGPVCFKRDARQTYTGY
jgi:Domain of unknown function (DUF5671)